MRITLQMGFHLGVDEFVVRHKDEQSLDSTELTPEQIQDFIDNPPPPPEKKKTVRKTVRKKTTARKTTPKADDK